jgi:hypothetical protein
VITVILKKTNNKSYFILMGQSCMGTLCDTDDDNISSIDITDVTAIELSEITRTKGPIDELSLAADDTAYLMLLL